MYSNHNVQQALETAESELTTLRQQVKDSTSALPDTTLLPRNTRSLSSAEIRQIHEKDVQQMDQKTLAAEWTLMGML